MVIVLCLWKFWSIGCRKLGISSAKRGARILVSFRRRSRKGFPAPPLSLSQARDGSARCAGLSNSEDQKQESRDRKGARTNGPHLRSTRPRWDLTSSRRLLSLGFSCRGCLLIAFSRRQLGDVAIPAEKFATLLKLLQGQATTT